MTASRSHAPGGARPAWMPERYLERWLDPFEALIRADLRPGVAILDVGSGRRPVLASSDRPERCVYVGLDISESELEAAPPGAYDEVVVGDVSVPIAGLDDRFDLIVSWQALEHVKPLDAAFDNMRR